MPIFRFKCELCSKETRKLSSHEVTSITCECSGTANKKLPESISSRVTELRDRHRGVQLRKDQEQIMKQRMRDHHDRYDLEEKIDRHGLDDAEKHKWTKKIKKI